MQFFYLHSCYKNVNKKFTNVATLVDVKTRNRLESAKIWYLLFSREINKYKKKAWIAFRGGTKLLLSKELNTKSADLEMKGLVGYYNATLDSKINRKSTKGRLTNASVSVLSKLKIWVWLFDILKIYHDPFAIPITHLNYFFR